MKIFWTLCQAFSNNVVYFLMMAATPNGRILFEMQQILDLHDFLVGILCSPGLLFMK
jgi:hypothetical protein